jgi:hypothetical protein
MEEPAASIFKVEDPADGSRMFLQNVDIYQINLHYVPEDNILLNIIHTH